MQSHSPPSGEKSPFRVDRASWSRALEAIVHVGMVVGMIVFIGLDLFAFRFAGFLGWVPLLSGLVSAGVVLALRRTPLLGLFVVVAISLLGRSLKGELPSQLSTTGVSYPEGLERAVGSSDAAITMLAARGDRFDQDLRKRDEILRLLVSEVLDLRLKIERREAERPHEGE